jgi:hypothetical protein
MAWFLGGSIAAGEDAESAGGVRHFAINPDRHATRQSFRDAAGRA